MDAGEGGVHLEIADLEAIAEIEAELADADLVKEPGGLVIGVHGRGVHAAVQAGKFFIGHGKTSSGKD